MTGRLENLEFSFTLIGTLENLREKVLSLMRILQQLSKPSNGSMGRSLILVVP